MSIFSRFLPFRTRRNNPPVPADGAADKVADAAPDQDTHAADTAPAGPPTAARTGGRAGTGHPAGASGGRCDRVDDRTDPSGPGVSRSP